MTLEALAKIVSALQAAEARFILVGGLAVIAHGYARVTLDCDIVLQLDEPNALKVIGVLESLGYRSRVPVPMAAFADKSQREMWARDKHMVVFTAIPSDRDFPDVDLFTRVPFDLDAEFGRSSQFRITDTVSAPVISLETLLEMKKDAGRGKDAVDIEHLERIHGRSGKID